MTIHVKTALILLATLLLGTLLGTLVVGPLLVRHRLGPFPGLRGPEHFVERFEDLIDPTDAQEDSVRTILEGYSGQFLGMNRRHHAEMASLMDSLQTDLATVLTEEQIDHLRERLERQRHWREGRRFRNRRFRPEGSPHEEE